MEAKKIIITGGATRIGAAIARKLSGSSVEIVIHYNKSKSKAERLKKELSNKGAKIYLVKGDLSKETDINKDMIRKSIVLFLLFNNSIMLLIYFNGSFIWH